MPITFSCPKCSSSYTVKDALAGEKGSCKKCGNSIRIPDAIATPKPVETGEVSLWKAEASQIENLGTFVFCGLIALTGLITGFMLPILFLLLPIAGAIAAWYWYRTKCKSFELTNQRLRMSDGVFSRIVEDVELFRVKDTMATQPFFLRLLSRGNVLVLSSDQIERRIELNSVTKPLELRELIRSHVTEQRKQKGVREVDMR